MPTRRPPTSPEPAPTPASGEKVLSSYRLPRSLVNFLKKEAERLGIDQTAFVNRALDGYATYFGLPAAAAVQLENDREALEMTRLEYYLHVLYRRSEEVQAQGAGFDSPKRKPVKKR